MPVEVADISGLSDDEKKSVLDRTPAGSILFFPGHEMLYLGENNGLYYTINDVSSLVNPENPDGGIIRPRSVTVSAMPEMTPVIPELGIYTIDTDTDFDISEFDFVEENSEVKLFDTYDYTTTAMRGEYSITGMKAAWNAGIYGKGVKERSSFASYLSLNEVKG